MDGPYKMTLSKVFQSIERYEDRMTKDIKMAIEYADEMIHYGDAPYSVLSDLLAQVFFSAEYCVQHPTKKNQERLRTLEKFGKVIVNAYFSEAEDLVKEARGEEPVQEEKQSKKKIMRKNLKKKTGRKNRGKNAKKRSSNPVVRQED